jgi:hypothetical protein
VVQVAFVLAYTGVVLAWLYQVPQSIWQWTNRGQFTAAFQHPRVDAARMASGFGTAVIVLTALTWLAVGTGVIVCTRLAQRGRNAARIVLAVVAGGMALSNLGGLAVALIGTAMLGDLPTSGTTARPTIATTPGWAITASAVLGAFALAIMILLILPRSNRYFSPGPGRRFAGDH